MCYMLYYTKHRYKPQFFLWCYHDIFYMQGDFISTIFIILHLNVSVNALSAHEVDQFSYHYCSM